MKYVSLFMCVCWEAVLGLSQLMIMRNVTLMVAYIINCLI